MENKNKFCLTAQAVIKASAACLLVLSLAACPGDDDDNGTPGTIPDTNAPTFTVTPRDGATSAEAATNITITASESIRNIDDSAITSTNVDGLITTLTEDGTAKAFDATIADNVITINPDADFTAGSTIIATLAQVEDLAGNPSRDPALTARFTISSAPGGRTTPTFTVTPTDGETGVAGDVNIVITASESIRNIDDSAIDNTNVDGLITTLTEDGTDKAFDATIAGNVITINPDADFTAGSAIIVTLAQVEGQAGNLSANPALTASFTISGGQPITDFTCAADSDDPTGKVIECMNMSEVGDSTLPLTYSWDFGDSSPLDTDEDPTHTYLMAGTYMIALTVTGANGRSRTFSQMITVMDLTTFAEGIAGAAGSGGKTWYLRRSGIALGIWPDTPTNSLNGGGAWWTFGDEADSGVTPLHVRPCILDDAYTFEVSGGTMRFVAATNESFYDDLQRNGGHTNVDTDGEDECRYTSAERGAPDHEVWRITRGLTSEQIGQIPSISVNDLAIAYALTSAEVGMLPQSGTDNFPDIYPYRDRSSDPDQGGFTYSLMRDVITLTGRGSYIGLLSKSNAGDQGWRVPETRTFKILSFTDTDDVDTMTLEMDIDGEGTGVWVFNLVHYGGTTTLPAIPTEAPPPPPDACSGTNENVPLTSASPTIDFESSYPSLTGFGGGAVDCKLNPASGGINPSSQVVEIVKDSAETFTGIFFDLEGTLDIRDNCGFKVKAYGEAGTTLSFKVEIPGSDPDISNEISTSVNPPAPALAANDTWEEFSYDFSGIIPADRSNVFTRLVFFPNLTLDASGNTTIYIDDITVDTSIGPCGG